MHRFIANRSGKFMIGAGAALLLGAGVQSALAAFVPPDSSNLVVWLNGSTGVTSSGGAVSAWADQSGNGNNATQATAADQPTLVASSPEFGGQPVLSFNGSSDYMQAPLPLNTVGGMTVFVVASHKSAVTARAILGESAGNYGGSSQWLLMQSTANSNLAEFNRDSGTNSAVTNGPLDTAPHIYTVTYDGSAETLTQSVDGSTSSSPALYANISETTLDIGSLIHFGAGFDYGDVNIGEILVYNTALSSADDATVQSYLNSKFISVPEPGSIGLLAVGGAFALRRKARRA